MDVFSVRGPCRRFIKDMEDHLEHLSTSCVEEGSNTSTIALQVIGGDKEGTQCLGVLLGPLVPKKHKYGDLALQVGGVSNLRQ
jgi:hypothetical protein